MPTHSSIYTTDNELFTRSDDTVIDMGILLGRVCQVEPNKDTFQALFSLSQMFMATSALSTLSFTRKQAMYPELLNQAIDEFCCVYASQSQLHLVDEARSDYMRLFVGIGDPLAAPWESVYLSQERSIFQESTLDVRRWFHSYGLKSKLEYNEPDDHVGLILEFICLTIKDNVDCAKPAGESDNFDCLSFFLNNHFLNWVETWNMSLQQHAQSNYYKVLGWLIVYIAVYFSNLLRVKK